MINLYTGMKIRCENLKKLAEHEKKCYGATQNRKCHGQQAAKKAIIDRLRIKHAVAAPYVAPAPAAPYVFSCCTECHSCSRTIDDIGLSFGFSSLPTSSDCQVVGLTLPICVRRFGVCVTRPGKSTWDHFEVDETPDPYRNSLIFCNNEFHMLGIDGNLADFYVGEEQGYSWEIVGVPKTHGNSTNQKFLLGVPKTHGNSTTQKFLLECGGDLLSVFVEKFGSRVQVLRLNRAKPSWDEVDSLGEYMIFVSGSSSFSAVAKIAGMENKIYFPRIFGNNIHCLSFSGCAQVSHLWEQGADDESQRHCRA
ncbi:hypothetical protein RJ639_033053 [Escallonia herrerae]|uniref:KIB1-4 beta-propeller domain-containing protein n=1 Tax=Escallonia herrerae TaxID=1293975 RepID=A0AA89B869_9ASTE|nr:hypothetical protein RJ639_033053 [Escallonia herrerae]